MQSFLKRQGVSASLDSGYMKIVRYLMEFVDFLPIPSATFSALSSIVYRYWTPVKHFSSLQSRVEDERKKGTKAFINLKPETFPNNFSVSCLPVTNQPKQIFNFSSSPPSLARFLRTHKRRLKAAAKKQRDCDHGRMFKYWGT